MARRQWLGVLGAAVAACSGMADGVRAAEVERLGSSSVATFSNDIAGGWAGYDVTAVGDLDGDGNEDMMVGVPFGDAGFGESGGAAYLFYGPVRRGGTLAATADAVFLGARPGSYTGEDVGAIGDLDGDGFDDLLVGVPGSIPGLQAGTPRPGEAYVFYGGKQRRSGRIAVGPECLETKVCDAGFSGVHPVDFAGFGVTKHPLGDVDGDGAQDLLVGAAGTGGLGGAAYLFYGDKQRYSGMTSVTSADAVFVHGSPAAFATRPMTGAGDLDGDGYADFAISAPHELGGGVPGLVYVYYGGPQRRAGVTPMTAADTVLTGAQEGDAFGRGIAGGEDVDADGLSDLVIGAPGGGSAGGRTGVVYLVRGAKQRQRSATLTATNATVIAGREDGGDFGVGVATGDLDRDGFAEIAAGAQSTSGGGQVHVLPGGPQAAALILAAATRRFDAASEGDRAGAAVAIFGRQVLIGATHADGEAGTAYVSLPRVDAPVTPTGGGGKPQGEAAPRPPATLNMKARRKSTSAILVRGRLGGGPCSGRIRLAARRGTRVLARRTVSVARSCAFTARLRARGRGVTVLATFTGTRELAPRSITARVR